MTNLDGKMTPSTLLDVLELQTDVINVTSGLIAGSGTPSGLLNVLHRVDSMLTMVADGFNHQVCDNCAAFADDVCTDLLKVTCSATTRSGRMLPAIDFLPDEGFGCNQFRRRK